MAPPRHRLLSLGQTSCSVATVRPQWRARPAIPINLTGAQKPPKPTLYNHGLVTLIRLLSSATVFRGCCSYTLPTPSASISGLRQPKMEYHATRPNIKNYRRCHQALLLVSDTRRPMPSQQQTSPSVSNHTRQIGTSSSARGSHLSSLSMSENNSNGTNHRTRRRLWQSENDIKLLELRRQGWSWKAIGQYFERHPQVAHRRYNNLLGLDARGKRHQHEASTSSHTLVKQMEVLKVWIYEQQMPWDQAAALLDTKVPVLQHRLRRFEEDQERHRSLLQQTTEESEEENNVKVKALSDNDFQLPKRVRFSRAGTAKLLKAIEEYGTANWESIARDVFDNKYTPLQLRRKFIKLKHWTQAREDRLMECVSLVSTDPMDESNERMWQAVAAEMAASNGASGVPYTWTECRNKWLDVLQRLGITPAEWSSPWSTTEKENFWALWKKHGQDWEVIASQLSDRGRHRTAKECRQQFSYLLKDVSKKGPKDPEEIEALRVYFAASPSGRVRWNTEMQDQLEVAVLAWREMHKGLRINWKWVARRLNIPGVTALKCFQRWNNYHFKDLRRPNSMGFTLREDQKLLSAVASYQRDIWRALETKGLFPNRSAESLQERWSEIHNSLVRVGCASTGTKAFKTVQNDLAKLVRDQLGVEATDMGPKRLIPDQDEMLKDQANQTLFSAGADASESEDDEQHKVQLARDRGIKKIWNETESRQLSTLLSKYGQSTIAWQHIAQTLGTTPERCKSRWRRISTSTHS